MHLVPVGGLKVVVPPHRRDVAIRGHLRLAAFEGEASLHRLVVAADPDPAAETAAVSETVTEVAAEAPKTILLHLPPHQLQPRLVKTPPQPPPTRHPPLPVKTKSKQLPPKLQKPTLQLSK